MTVAIYARYSSDLQSEKSIDDQVHACKAFAERAGLAAPFSVYADAALSGASMATRPQLQALLADIRGRRVSVIIAEAIDRLSRDQADVHIIRRTATANNVRLLTIADGEVSSMVAGLKGIMAEQFLADLAQKTRRGLIGVAREGRSAGGICYGYTRVAGEKAGLRVIDEAQAAIVREIFARYVAGETPRQIVGNLNRRGVKGPRGGAWHQSGLNGDPRCGDGLLRQDLYRGRLVFNRRRFLKDPETGRRRSVLNPESEWIVTPAPDLRIVDEPTWLAAQTRRRTLADIPALRDRRRPKRLLSGLLTCGCCGAPMVIASRAYLACGGARDRGVCSQTRFVRAPVIEARVLAGLKTTLLAPELIAEAVRAYHDEMAAAAADNARRRADLGKDLAEARRRAERAADQLLAHDGPSPILSARLKDAEATLARLEAAAAAAAPPPVVTLHPAAAEAYRARVAALEAAFADPQAQTAGAAAIAAVRDLIAGVAVKPDASQPDGWAIEIEGQLAALLALSAGPETQKAPGLKAGGFADLNTVEVGAGRRSGLASAPRIRFAA